MHTLLFHAPLVRLYWICCCNLLGQTGCRSHSSLFDVLILIIVVQICHHNSYLFLGGITCNLVYHFHFHIIGKWVGREGEAHSVLSFRLSTWNFMSTEIKAFGTLSNNDDNMGTT